MEFEVNDHVYLRVSPNKGVSCFGIKGKLAPRYIGRFPIVEKFNPVAYRLQLPGNLERVHNVFHVSQLKKCLKPPIDVVIKLAPRYIGRFPIVEKFNPVAYRLQLPGNLERVHNVFHVSQLKKCLKPPIDVVISDTEQLQEDLSYPETPARILDQKDRATRKRTITFYTVQWSNHTEDEATWEQEEFLDNNFPEFLASRLR